jgi:glycosyltransferase involved in cell wall biosynthesis
MKNTCMKITIVTDAWAPQVNGVVRTLEKTITGLLARGYEVQRISPEQFYTVPCPSYPEIRLAMTLRGSIGKRIADFAPDHIHISTEGPLGIAARRWCVANGIRFTTAFHTRFADYAAARTHLSPHLFWRFLRWFHQPSTQILAATPRLMQDLKDQGLSQTRLWSRGVDVMMFRPDHSPNPALADLTKPLMLNVGRVAVEKNLEAFLRCDVPGTKIIVGDGPARDMLQKKYPEAVFLGALHGATLAATYAAADVFVFPSLTDTFGLVTLEALACGTPVAAFPVAGPQDIIGDGHGIAPHWGAPIGCTDKDLTFSIHAALQCDRRAARAYASRFSWDISLTQFISALAPIKAAHANHHHVDRVPLAA